MGTKHVAIYLRVSTKDQSTDAQLAELTQLVERRGWKYRVFCDKGQSGAKESRPAFDEMMREVRRGRISAICIWALDRLARSLRQLLEISQELQRLNVDLVAVANDEFKRFEYGIPPAKNGDYAFLLHLIKSLKSTGKGAIILPHGVLFRGNKEADIRRNLIKQGYIKGIIGLPPNLFYGTGIPACIVVIDKEHAQVRTGIFMIDASKSFMKDGNKNRLRAQDIHKIVDVFNRQVEWPRYSRMVPASEIANPANDYNLNIPRYIDSAEPEDLHDLDAHLHGGIPIHDVDALGSYWQVFPSLRAELFEPGDRAGYNRAKVETQQVRPTILKAAEFTAYSQKVTAIFGEWRAEHEPMLKKVKEDAQPKAVIHILSEDLLERFASLPLLNNYDAYQRLMDYWVEVMQDDVYLIGSDGWVEAARPRLAIDNKEKNIRETPDLTVERKDYKTDLIPPRLILARHFAREKGEVDVLVAKHEAAERELEEFVEENSGEDGLLEEAKTDKGAVTKASVTARLKEIKKEEGIEDEKKILTRCLELIGEEASTGQAVKGAQAELDVKVLAQYAKLTEAEIKTLVVDEKWFGSISTALEGEVQRVTQTLLNRVRELENRYIAPLLCLKHETDELGDKVQAHLERMASARQDCTHRDTDIGVIPEDWTVKELRAISSMHGRIGWQGLKQSEFTSNPDDPFLITGMNFKDGEIEWEEVYHVSHERYEIAPQIQLRPGDVLMTKDGTIGKLLYIGEIPRPGTATLNSHLLVFRPIGNSFVPLFLFYQLSSRRFADHVELSKSGSTFFGITQQATGQFKAVLPPLPEQEAVAEALSDIDGEIAALERRRDKMKAIKQGMMQSLLTGRIRLLKTEAGK